MKNLILFGPPGSGKGTQADLIVKKLNLDHISTGDVFRSNIQQKTDLGKLASEFMSVGKLVPDDLTIKLLANEMDLFSSSHGFIFDGFPRTVEQAKALDILLGKKNMNLSLVISLEVSESELVKRLLNRGLSSGRSDDQDEKIIRNRIKVYEDETFVLKKYYSDLLNDAFYQVNGELNVEDIFANIYNILIKY